MSTATMNPLETVASNKGGDFENPPPGTHTAICVAVIDCGTHEGAFKGKSREDRKVYLAWELSEQLKLNGDPFVVAGTYNFLVPLTRKSGLRLMLESWSGRTYNDEDKIDLRRLAGRGCLLNLAEDSKDDKTFIRIKSVIPLPRSMKAPTPFYSPFIWASLPDPFNLSADGDWLPWIFGKSVPTYIEESMECRGIPVTDHTSRNGSRPANEDGEDPDDIPF